MELIVQIGYDEYPVVVKGHETVSDILQYVGGDAGMELDDADAEHDGIGLGGDDVMSRLPLQDGDVLKISLPRRVVAKRELQAMGWFVNYGSFVKAVESGDYRSAELFIEAIENIQNKRSNYGQTLLQSTAERNLVTECEFLLSHGADPEVRTLNGWTALHYATFYGNAAIVELLLRYGASLRWDGELDTGPTIKTPLMFAARNGDLGVVKMLCENGGDPCQRDFEGSCAVHYAVLNGHLEVVRYFTEVQGLDLDVVNGKGMTPLHIAVEVASHVVVRLLLQAGASPNASSPRHEVGTPLHHAIRRRDLATTNLLLSHGASTSALDSLNRTPLAIVLSSYTARVRCGQDEPGAIIRRLLEAGADPDDTLCRQLATEHGLQLERPNEG